MKKRFLPIFITGIILFINNNAIDNPHFYRANFFWGEPRFEKSWLTTLDTSLAGGSTTKARNNKGQITPLLNIYGLQNMRVLGTKVANLDPANPLDAILIQLSQTPPRDNFGKLEYFGRFSTVETTFNFYQNIINGFFLQAYLPIRYLRIGSIDFVDQSPTDDIFPNSTTPVWVDFLQNFNAILAQFNLTQKNTSESGIGDFSFLVGWVRNYEETCYIDYIDVDAKIGVLFPTAKKRNEDVVFSLPLGYNGHYGVPLKFDCSLGYWEWLTAGIHLGALFLIEKNQTIRMKTAAEQNGFFDLVKGKAKIDPGTLWEVSNYIKADHFAKGLSCLIGYTYTRKDLDCINPFDTTQFDPLIVNRDQRFLGWNMHVIHFMAEYDFTKKSSDLGPRVGVFYNLIVGGKRIFNTGITNAYVGIDCSWEF